MWDLSRGGIHSSRKVAVQSHRSKMRSERRGRNKSRRRPLDESSSSSRFEIISRSPTTVSECESPPDILTSNGPKPKNGPSSPATKRAHTTSGQARQRVALERGGSCGVALGWLLRFFPLDIDRDGDACTCLQPRTYDLTEHPPPIRSDPSHRPAIQTTGLWLLVWLA